MMKLLPLILVVLLPSVLLAGVIVTSSPADTESFISVAREAMDAGDYVTAWALFECALRRNPQSPEALAGRLAARAVMEEHANEEVALAVS